MTDKVNRVFPDTPERKLDLAMELELPRVAGKKARSIMKLNAETLLPGQPPH